MIRSLRKHCAFAFGLLMLGHSVASAEQDYAAIPFSLEATNRIQPADFNGDGLQDLLAAADNRLSVYLQKKSDKAFDFSKPDTSIELPGNAAGWTLDAAGDRQRILALIDGGQVQAWSLTEGRFGKPITLLDHLSGSLPAGSYPMNFVRDINGDKRADLLIPGQGEMHIYLQSADGRYGNALQVRSRLLNYSRLSAGDDLSSQVGQRVRIPEMNIRDVNNDQRNDLVASSEESIDVFLAKVDGSFPHGPSYSVDLKALQERVGEVDFDNVDYSNLSGLLAYTYEIEMEDIDGDNIEDVLVREGGKVTVFGGTDSGVNMDKPRQILKSSGNVLAISLRDEDGDDRKDLWLMRIEDISLANLFLWLAISGSVEVETFVYKNQGDRFASRPHRKVTLSVKFPSILRSVDLVNSAIEAEPGIQKVVRATRAQLDGAESPFELAVIDKDSLAIYSNVIDEKGEQRFLGQSDFRRDKDNYDYDLGAVLASPASSANRDLQRIQGRKPDLMIPYQRGMTIADQSQADLFAWEMNGDGRDDFFVLTGLDGNTVSGLLLLSK
ncbi:VCBS repeat-containing protein [Proteobacteria bacterium 005FR1]|nr:VCBS repeat-containing protein [Proteobacteria bacterium 005FR1]